MHIVGIVPNYNYLQIYTHGCHYNCNIVKINGEDCFKFKGTWYKVADYMTDSTRINNIGSDFNTGDKETNV